MSRILIITLFCFLLFPNILVAQENIINPAALYSIGADSINREEPRKEFFAFARIKDYQNGDINTSHFYQPLTGNWKYKYFSSSLQLNPKVVEPDYDDTTWQAYAIGSKNLEESSAIRTQEGKFNPTLPIQNPVAVFRTSFKVPMTWDERQVYLSFNQLSGASNIYVNGEKIGYNEDSKSYSDFDITSVVHEGLNSLVVVSYAYSISSYLEAGKQFSGLAIDGDVTVWSAPKVQLRDYIVKTSFDPTYENGLLEFGAIIQTHYLNKMQARIFFEMRDDKGKIVDSQSKYSDLNMRTNDTVYFNVPLKNAKKWSANEPNLYNVTIKVQREMRFTEFADFQVGFRQIDIRDNRLYINNKFEKIIGLELKQNNIPKDSTELINLFNKIKSAGINTLWVVGVQSRHFYHYANKLGLYIFNSTNINSSYTENNLRYGLANNRFIVDKYISRGLSTLEAAKGQPSVIAFSLGENGGNGYNMYEVYMAMKERDKTRPIVYRGANREWNTDIFLSDNLNLEQLESYKTTSQHPTIIMDFEKDNMENKWNVVEVNEGISGVFLKDISVIENSNFADNFARFDVKISGNKIVVKNVQNFKDRDISVDYRLYKSHILDEISGKISNRITGGEEDKTEIINGSFVLDVINAEDEFSHTIDEKELRHVKRIDITLREKNGYLILKDSFSL